MEAHLSIPDTDFQEAFQHCRLDPALFSHEAHLRMAWLYLRQYGPEETVVLFPRHLKAYVESLGATDKYHVTLTIAGIKAVNHFMLRSKASDFTDFLAEFPVLKENFKELITAHYGIDIFNSPRAKREYIEPDLLPFE